MGVADREQKGNIEIGVVVGEGASMPDTLEELRALEREVEREWWWLQMQAERAAGVLTSFREMQEQARDVDRRRVEIAVRIAQLEGRVVSCRRSSTCPTCG
jgi:hypothetical protein